MSYYDNEDLILACDALIVGLSKLEQEAFVIDIVNGDSTLGDQIEKLQKDVKKIRAKGA